MAFSSKVSSLNMPCYSRGQHARLFCHSTSMRYRGERSTYALYIVLGEPGLVSAFSGYCVQPVFDVFRRFVHDQIGQIHSLLGKRLGTPSKVFCQQIALDRPHLLVRHRLDRGHLDLRGEGRGESNRAPSQQGLTGLSRKLMQRRSRCRWMR